MLELLASSPSLATSTFVLALVTSVLVIATVVLAWYGREEVAAQERPALLIDERRIEFQQENAGEREERIVLDCYVDNAGRGPALNIEATVDRPENLQVIDAPPLQSLPTGEGRPPQVQMALPAAGAARTVSLARISRLSGSLGSELSNVCGVHRRSRIRRFSGSHTAGIADERTRELESRHG